MNTNLQSEQNVLSYIIENPKAITEAVEILSGTDCFHEKKNKTIYQTIIELYEGGNTATFARICQMLHLNDKSGEHMSYIQHLGQLKEVFVNFPDFIASAQHVEDLYRLREIEIKATKIAYLAKTKENDAKIKDKIEELTTFAEVGSKTVQVDTSESLMNKITSELDTDPSLCFGVKTGLNFLDKFTNGWQNSDIIIIAGRPGMGKTIAGCFHFYQAALNNYPAAFFTFEMSSQNLMNRIISQNTNIAYKDINSKKLSSQEKNRILEFSENSKKLPMYFYDAKQSDDISDISATITSWKRKFGLKLIVIDYIQLIRDKTAKGNEVDTIASVSRKIKRLQSRLQIPIICLAQISRNVESKGDKRPTMSDLKGSGQLEQDASIVIGLHREDVSLRERFESENRYGSYIPKNEIEYIFSKNRNGETGHKYFGCNPAYSQIYEI